MITLELDLENFDNFQDVFSPENAADLKKLLGDTLRQDLRKRFLSSPRVTSGGEVYGGEYWKELSSSYLLQNPHRLGGQIYIDTGRLQESLTLVSHPEQIDNLNETIYEFGTQVPYFDKLQEARPIIFWHPELEEEIKTAVENFMNEKVNGEKAN